MDALVGQATREHTPELGVLAAPVVPVVPVAPAAGRVPVPLASTHAQLEDRRDPGVGPELLQDLSSHVTMAAIRACQWAAAQEENSGHAPVSFGLVVARLQEVASHLVTPACTGANHTIVAAAVDHFNQVSASVFDSDSLLLQCLCVRVGTRSQCIIRTSSLIEREDLRSSCSCTYATGISG
jgi:hypothetical protein